MTNTTVQMIFILLGGVTVMCRHLQLVTSNLSPGGKVVKRERHGLVKEGDMG
jgi:hypothetical protein